MNLKVIWEMSGNYYLSADKHGVLFSRPIVSLYYSMGLCFSLIFAYIITDKTFDFFTTGDAYTFSYNYLFLSIIEGKQSVPIKYIGFEGLYLPDGTAYMYYGIGPALLRVFFHPFLDLQQVPVARFLVWSLVAVSGFVCQSTLLLVVRNSSIRTSGLAVAALFVGGIAVWLASPLLILTSGASLYHEPIALAFLCTVIFVRAAIPLTFSAENSIGVLMVCSVAAAVAVHARPHVAVGLYLGTVALWFWAIVTVWGSQKAPHTVTSDRQPPRESLKSLSFAGLGICLILGVSGLTYLWLIAQRGGPLVAMVSGGEAVYGSVFFGVEDAQSVRMMGFAQDGIFNLKRIIPNGLFHAIGGWNLFEQLREWLGVAYIRREPPFAGFVMLWMPWVVLAGYTVIEVILRGIYGLKSGVMMRAVPPLVTTVSMAVIFVIILSFGQVAFRYKVEIWPVFWVLSLLSLPSFLALLSTLSSNLKRLAATAIICLVVVGSGFSLIHAHEYTRSFNIDSIWSFDECVEHLKNALTPLSLPDSLCN